MSHCYTCPLCTSQNIQAYLEDKKRRYFQCEKCQLVFVDPLQRLDSRQEKSEYDKHNNSPEDIAYRAFLARLYRPVLAQLKTGDSGMDFGCGPGPTLSVMFAESGFPMKLYDSYYFDDKKNLDNFYNFITASEVVEHLYEPGEVIKKLWAQLLPGGVLGVMTKLVINKNSFATWHYKNDPTHVCFFSSDTFKWLANELSANLEFFGKDVILLKREMP